jgi:hypothetical protein
MDDQPSARQLPREILPLSNWHSIAILIPGMLVLIILVNIAAIAYLDKYSINFGYWTIHQKWNLLGRLDSPVDWLILGDSSCNQGVMPSVFQTELNESAINLCTTGDMGALGDLWILEEYIQRFGPPKNVLVVHVYDIWYRSFNPVRLGQIPRPWGFWEQHTFGSEFMVEQDVRFNTFLEHYVPLYSQNVTIGRIIRRTLAGQLNPFIPMWNMNQDGFVPAEEPKPEIVLAGETQQIDFVSQNSFYVSYLNDQAMRDLAEAADTFHFNLYLANAPVFADLYANAIYQAYYQSIRTYLQEVADQSTYVHYISSVRTFPAEQMQNPDHLIVSGAEEYTKWLVVEILLTSR